MKEEIPRIEFDNALLIRELINSNKPFVINQPNGWKAYREELLEKLDNKEVVVYKDNWNSGTLHKLFPTRMKYKDYRNQTGEFKLDTNFCYHIFFNLKNPYPSIANFCKNNFLDKAWAPKKYNLINFWHAYKGMGSKLHYDPVDNFNLQLFGQKDFYIAPAGLDDYYYPKKPWTFEGHFSKVEVVEDQINNKFSKIEELRSKFQKVTLEEGNILYIPCCWWHHVQATDDVNININFWWLSFKKATKFPRQMGRFALTSSYRKWISWKY